MSLILTQSTPGNANSYVNRFKNTFELPPNAEIAVQEVVMNRKASFTVRPDTKFYVRHTPDGVVNSVHTQIVLNTTSSAVVSHRRALWEMGLFDG